VSAQPPFDLAVIGAGPGGYVAAVRAGQLGLNTVLIERDSRFGGTCTLRGCIPTKALLRDAHLLQEVRKAVQQGMLKSGEVEFDFAKIQARKSDVIQKSAKGVDYLLKKNKVQVVRGRATLLSPSRIKVDADGGASEVSAKNIIVATGSEAKSLPGYTVDERLIISNIGALDLTAVPASLVIVGAGAVGVEFASIYNSFGTKVTLLEALPNLVPLEDEEVSKELKRLFSRKGIDVQTKARLESVKSLENSVEATFQTEKGEARTVTADKLLMATGRAPNTANIGLEAIGVAMERGFIKVDGSMQTNVPGVYAVGDVVPTPLLAHVAFQEGVIAVEKIAGKNPKAINYTWVPNCTYCDPQIASVGWTEAKARAEGRNVRVGKFPFMAVAKARIDDATDGFIKIVADEEYGEVLGVHMIGAAVTEMISEAVVSMGLEGTVADLANLIHAHPTLSEGMHEALEGVFGAPIHI
jgi:dihydrolipoamide dehydrogenase